MLQQEFLKSMRYLAASVSIISAKDSNDKPYAMTASSVTSLTLEPPSILVCVNHDASIHDHLLNDEAKFCVNLLKKNQQDIATLCSIKEKEDQRFEDKNWNLDSVPFLQGSQSNIFCKVKKYLLVRDSFEYVLSCCPNRGKYCCNDSSNYCNANPQ